MFVGGFLACILDNTIPGTYSLNFSPQNNFFINNQFSIFNFKTFFYFKKKFLIKKFFFLNFKKIPKKFKKSKMFLVRMENRNYGDFFVLGTLKDRGISTVEEQSSNDSEKSQSVYELPFNLSHILSRCCCTQYLPFLPKYKPVSPTETVASSTPSTPMLSPWRVLLFLLLGCENVFLFGLFRKKKTHGLKSVNSSWKHSNKTWSLFIPKCIHPWAQNGHN